MNPRLPAITNNYEKSITYKDQMARFKLATSQGFYYEGIFILYAMLEDRLSSFLFHAGVVDKSRQRITTNETVKHQLIPIINPDNSPNITVKKITSKIQIMQRIIAWSESYQVAESEDTFQDILATCLNKSSGREEMKETLASIEKWCSSRNELVHALMNKSTDALEESLKSLVAEGYTHTRKLDNFVRSFKVHNTIRKQFNIQ